MKIFCGGRALALLGLAGIAAGCSSMPASGTYKGKATLITTAESAVGTPIGDKTTSSGDGVIVIAPAESDAITLDVTVPRLKCKLTAKKQQAGLLVDGTTCPFAQSDATNAGTVPAHVSGRVDHRGKSVSIALSVEATGRLSSQITFDADL